MYLHPKHWAGVYDFVIKKGKKYIPNILALEKTNIEINWTGTEMKKT